MFEVLEVLPVLDALCDIRAMGLIGTRMGARVLPPIARAPLYGPLCTRMHIELSDSGRLTLDAEGPVPLPRLGPGRGRGSGRKVLPGPFCVRIL